MAYWLKAAEDLFEVVDRRAKLVVSELADEQSDSQLPASNGQGSGSKRAKARRKAKKTLSIESHKASDATGELTSTQPSKSDVATDEDRTALQDENNATPSHKSIPQTATEEKPNTIEDASSIKSSEGLATEDIKHDTYPVEVPISAFDVDASASVTVSNGEILNEKAFDIDFEQPPSLPAKDMEVSNENSQENPIDVSETDKLRNIDVPSNIDQESLESSIADTPANGEAPQKDVDIMVEPLVNQPNQQQQHKADASPKRQHKADASPKRQHQADMSPKRQHKAESSLERIQDQLDEAQGLLKTAVSTGQSKEARLARVCAGLSTRLQEYKSENAQLEELLVAERELSKSYEARMKQLQQDLSISKGEVTKVESNMAEALAAKNSEIESLVNSMDALKKQAALSEGNLASLQANMESIMRNRELTETRMMQALREELASVERRAEEERVAHSATKLAAMEREVELEHRAVETSSAIARLQRIADERTAKTTELEQKVALLEVECASLNQELQDMEARARRGQKKSPEDANQMQAWQEEVERARQGQRDAESKLSSMEAEVQKMRVEMAAMKRDAEHYSRHEHLELEKRYRELTDLLYYKQTQLEAMSSEKAAAEFQLEKELKRLREAQVEAERSRVSRRASSSWEEEAEMKELEPLPLHHRHMEAASMQLQKAAKLLDSGAARATRFLWRYPTARLILLFYLVFVHLFLMYLLHHLQEQADALSAREVAESMGLTNPTIP
ncbi:golgin candidate 1 isoform X2 [Euphorbia lathyris]|uniref:golgin candidate 1 isoform X2 n=1 Tax=Euphorbia lathyris TaxID=212925 RepID=UPI00331416CC